jgi:hypothetical protein
MAPFFWSILSPPLTWACVELVSNDRAMPATAAMRMLFIFFMFFTFLLIVNNFVYFVVGDVLALPLLLRRELINPLSHPLPKAHHFFVRPEAIRQTRIVNVCSTHVVPSN